MPGYHHHHRSHHHHHRSHHHHRRHSKGHSWGESNAKNDPKQAIDLSNMRRLVRALAKCHGVSTRHVLMTRVPFFNFLAFLLAKYPRMSICEVAVCGGKCWRLMKCQQKKPYCLIAKIVKATQCRK